MKLIKHLIIASTLFGSIHAREEANPLFNERQTAKEELVENLKCSNHPLALLVHSWNRHTKRTSEGAFSDHERLEFLKLCHSLGLEVRLSTVHEREIYDFRLNGVDIGCFDFDAGGYYLALNNETEATSEMLQDDPLLFLRCKQGERKEAFSFVKNLRAFAHFDIFHPSSGTVVVLGEEELFSFPLSKDAEKSEEVSLLSQSTPSYFDHESPYFELDAEKIKEAQEIWWQISPSSSFDFIASNLNQAISATRRIELSLVDETYLNSNETYYFRVCLVKEGGKQSWSKPHAFKVEKPLAPSEIEFDKTLDGDYEINWERFAPEDDATEYLVFGSNAFDFIPSLYYSNQVNGFVGSAVTDEESVCNLIATTKEAKIRVKGDLAYYRVIARKGNAFSTPSSLIRVYDQGLIQQRTVLQYDGHEKGFAVIKRKLFPVSEATPYVSFSFAAPCMDNLGETSVDKLIRFSRTLSDLRDFSRPMHVSSEIWDAVFPYLMPDNHPCKAKLDRLAAKTRFILDPKTMKKNGFSRAERVGRWSRVCATPHVDMQEYYFKVYCDNEAFIKYDWKRWVHRCKGVELINTCIKKHRLQSLFKVPRKWIYLLPANPSPPVSPRYLRKNCILVCDNMRILEHSENEKKYKHKVDKKRLKAIYVILQECGLYDSVFIFNMPFNKEGFICLIDTEYWHKWPVPFNRLTKFFPKDLQDYWTKLTKSGLIPDGENSKENIPRNDRRDLSTLIKK